MRTHTCVEGIIVTRNVQGTLSSAKLNLRECGMCCCCNRHPKQAMLCPYIPCIHLPLQNH